MPSWDCQSAQSNSAHTVCRILLYGETSETVDEVVFSICRGQLQSVTVCHRLITFLAQPLLQLIPVFARCLIVDLLGKYLDDIDDRKPPCFRRGVIDAADRMFLEDGRLVVHGQECERGKVLDYSKYMKEWSPV